MDGNIISMIFHFDFDMGREGGPWRKTILMMFTQFVCACQRGRMYLIPSPSLLVTLCALWRLTRTFHYARRSTLVDDIIAAAVQKVFLPLPLHLSVCTVSSCHSFGRIFRQWLWAKGHSRQILLSVCALHGSCGATLIWQRRRRRQKFFINLIEPQSAERKWGRTI